MHQATASTAATARSTSSGRGALRSKPGTMRQGIGPRARSAPPARAYEAAQRAAEPDRRPTGAAARVGSDLPGHPEHALAIQRGELAAHRVVLGQEMAHVVREPDVASTARSRSRRSSETPSQDSRSMCEAAGTATAVRRRDLASAAAMNSPDCCHPGQPSRWPGVRRRRCSSSRSRASRSSARLVPRIVPFDDEPVLAVLDVLLVAGDRRHHARRAHVEALERRPEHALDARELEHHVGVGVGGGQLALRSGPITPSAPSDVTVLPSGSRRRHVARLAHLAPHATRPRVRP